MALLPLSETDEQCDLITELTGLFDFEPSMCGHPEYDLKAPAILIAQSDKAVWREFLLGYGYRPEEVPDLSRRLMAYALLHRFARLPHYFELMPAPDARTLDDLADAWFGI